MNLIQKALFNLGLFKGINDNPYYSTYQISGGFRFNDFNQKTVIDKGYAGNADLYSIVRKIATTGAAIPRDLYEINSEGEKELVTSGELYDLLQQPNRLQTMNEFVEEALIYLLLSGNNYVSGYKALGMSDVFRELNNLPSQFVTIEGGSIADPIKAYWYQELNNIKFDVEDIMHTRYSNPKGGADSLYGLSPLEAGNDALQSSNNTYEAKGAIIKNSGVNGIISSASERSFTAEQGDAMQDAWEKKNKNPLKFGRNLVTSAAINYTQLGLSPDKLQLLEGSVLDLRTLCNLYSVPSQLFNDIAGTTFNNMAAAKKSLYNDAVIPNVELWLQNFNNWFISSWANAEGKNYCLELNTSSIEALQADQKLEAEKDKIRMEGINTVINMPISNEAKALLLQQDYGYTEEEATLITTNETINEND
jgi:HK97 family phage portal protein